MKVTPLCSSWSSFSFNVSYLAYLVNKIINRKDLYKKKKNKCVYHSFKYYIYFFLSFFFTEHDKLKKKLRRLLTVILYNKIFLDTDLNMSRPGEGEYEPLADMPLFGEARPRVRYINCALLLFEFSIGCP